LTTFVLIHGGGTTARFWDRLVPELGHPHLAVDLPGRGPKPAELATLTVHDVVVSVLADIAAHHLGDELVLVAHSSGGLVVPGVVRDLDDRVRRIVLSSASVPPEGGCGLDCMKPGHRARTEAAYAWADGERAPVPSSQPPEDSEMLREAYGGRLDDETLAFMADPVRSVPDSLNVYRQAVSWAGLDVPVTYVRAARDRPVPPGLQDDMIANLPGPTTVVRWDCGHIPAVTRAPRFAELLNTLC